MRRTLSTLATLAAVLPTLLVSGCGGDSTGAGGSGGSSPSSSSSTSPAQGTVVNVTVHGNNVTPNGDRVTAKINQPVTIHVSADRAGELHVHSTPEQELKYGVGKTTLKITVDKPGIVDIEDHIADVVVVQLEVS
jgi:hypothetical protein